ncbi:hypothetical protein MBLNU13_g00456t1 [Cladosporium sp. NU13]
MSNPNGQPTDLRGMARTKRRSNNRHTTFSARERPATGLRNFQQPVTFTPPTEPPVPQTKTVQPHTPEAVNHNPAGAPHPLLQQAATPSTSNNNTTLPVFTQTQPTNNPKAPTAASEPTPQQSVQPKQNPQQQQTPPPQPKLRPQSPAASITSENLEDIDLRSPSDDPDYDFIDASEATHSARNAQPDRVDKYPEHADGAKVGGVGGAGEEAKAKAVEAKKKQKPRGWFSFLK